MGIIVVPISKKHKGPKLKSRKTIASRAWQKRTEICMCNVSQATCLTKHSPKC